MTVLEELVQIVHTLSTDEQRRVLEVAAKLRDAQKRPDLSLARVDPADASWDAWSEQVRARSTIVLEEEQRRLQALDLVDERWNARTNRLPDDMLPSSETSVEA